MDKRVSNLNTIDDKTECEAGILYTQEHSKEIKVIDIRKWKQSDTTQALPRQGHSQNSVPA